MVYLPTFTIFLPLETTIMYAMGRDSYNSIYNVSRRAHLAANWGNQLAGGHVEDHSPLTADLVASTLQAKPMGTNNPMGSMYAICARV